MMTDQPYCKHVSFQYFMAAFTVRHDDGASRLSKPLSTGRTQRHGRPWKTDDLAKG